MYLLINLTVRYIIRFDTVLYCDRQIDGQAELRYAVTSHGFS